MNSPVARSSSAQLLQPFSSSCERHQSIAASLCTRRSGATKNSITCGSTFIAANGSRSASRHWRSRRRGVSSSMAGTAGSGPAQALEDPLAHHPVLVVLAQEVERLGKVRDALAGGGFFRAVGHVGAPIAALRALS